MFKKTLAFMLSLTLLMLPCFACAFEPTENADFIVYEKEASAEESVTWKMMTATVYLPVQRYQQTNGGWSKSQTFYPAVAEITYKYWTAVNPRSDTWEGGAEISDGCPIYAVLVTLPTQDLDLSVQQVSKPNYHFTACSDGYSLQIVGGVFKITYNNKLYYKTDGTLDHTESTTVSRTHNITVAGP